MWCSICQFICQYKNSSTGFIITVRVDLRKSESLSFSPQCWVNPVKYEAQLAMKTGKEIISGSIHKLEVSAITNKLPWKDNRNLDHIIDLWCSLGLSVWSDCSHSWLGISFEPVFPKADKNVRYIVENKPPLPKTRPVLLKRLILKSCINRIGFNDGSNGERFSRSNSGCIV